MSTRTPKAETVSPETGREARSERAIEQIRVALAGLRYGQISVIVQDGVVIQIDRTERTRLDRIAH